MTFHSPKLFSFLVFAFFVLSCASPSSAEHHETWIEVRSPHFTVLSNAGEHEGRLTALQFEEVRALFLHLYPKLRVDSGKPTIVFALKNEDSLKLLIPSYGQNSKAMKIGGFYHVGYDKNFAVIRTDIRTVGRLPFQTLYHEYTHAFFRYNFRGLPVWLDEGLAEYYGNTRIDSKTASVGLPDENQLRFIQSKPFIPIGELVSIDRSSPLYNTQEHAGIFYAESWALVHYLTISEEMRGQDLINKYLRTLHDTDDPIQAAQQTFGDLKKLSNSLEGYVRRNAYSFQNVPLQADLSEKSFSARTLSSAEGSLALADYLLRSNHLPEGLERLHEVEKIDSATPGYHGELGHYHFYNHDYINAEKELQLAVAANPDDSSSHLDLANLYYRRDGYTKQSTPKIRAELEKVVSLNPDFSPAYAFLSVVYRQEPDRDPNKSFKAANRAAELEPGRLVYLSDMGYSLLAMNRISDARRVSAVIQKLATTPEDRNLATNFAKQVEYKTSHPNSTSPDDFSGSQASPSKDSANSAESSPASTQAEGQISELICGHPPEVMLTLTTGAESLLLHITDVAKIRLVQEGKTPEPVAIPCSGWKDRHARVDFRPLSTGMLRGEVQSISFQ